MRDPLTEKVIGAAMKVHRVLGPGFLESVYGNALEIELTNSSLMVEREVPLKVHYEDAVVGEFKTDFLIEDNLILELKAVENLTKAHEVQTVNYLAATKKDIALLINFGATSLQYKRKHRNYQPPDIEEDPNPVNPVNPVQKSPV